MIIIIDGINPILDSNSSADFIPYSTAGKLKIFGHGHFSQTFLNIGALYAYPTCPLDVNRLAK